MASKRRDQHGMLDVKRLYAAAQFRRAEDLARSLLKRRPGDPELLFQLGIALIPQGLFDEAGDTLDRALLIRPGTTPYLRSRGVVHRLTGQFEDARRCFDQALASEPAHEPTIADLANLHLTTGDLDAARRTIQPLIDKRSTNPSAACAAARVLKSAGEIDRAIEVLERCRSGSDLVPTLRVDVLFLLGECLNAAAQYDDAFDAYEQANRLRATRFDAPLFEQSVDRLIREWTREKIASLQRAPGGAARDDRPVLIVGMPRSGTSLVEQILATHPEVHGAGELPHIVQTAYRIQQGAPIGDPSVLQHPSLISAATLDRAAQEYREHLDSLDPDALRITDKMPGNVMHLGLAALMLPGGRVIHCARNPIDTCLSCYFQNFGSGMAWPYDLASIGAYYRGYRRVTDHWRAVLDIPLLDVQYESLVADVEARSREMIEFLGLAWDDACLGFHESDRIVITQSNEQVRRPVYSSSVERWRHYEEHLGPLLDALGPEIRAEAGA